MAKLYDYFRSSAAFRVRIVLNLKGLSVEQIPVDLKPGASQHLTDAYKSVNPEQRVPFFSDDTVALSQSMAILEYLEERFPKPSILPGDAAKKAYIRSLANLVATDIHPINNLSILTYLKDELAHDGATVKCWIQHWIIRGFVALEKQTKRVGLAGDFLIGDTLTLADIALIPQIYNARRFDVDMGQFTLLSRIEKAAYALDAVKKASPDEQGSAAL